MRRAATRAERFKGGRASPRALTSSRSPEISGPAGTLAHAGDLTPREDGGHWGYAAEAVGTMNWKLTAGLTLVVVGILVAGAYLVGKARSHPTVTVTLRIAVSPNGQVDFVAAQARSARFKYLIGKQAGVKPVLAQKLSIKPVPNSSLLEAQVAVLTRDEGRRYAEGFVETLQLVCGRQAQLTLAGQSIR
jgi:hypothetical protein